MTPAEILTGPVTDDINRLQRDRAIWGSFRTMLSKADEETRGKAQTFILWVMSKYAREAAMAVRRLADNKGGAHSLYRCLRDLGKSNEAERLKNVAAHAGQFATKVIAHPDPRRAELTLQLGQLEKDLNAILKLYREAYEEVTGAAPAKLDIDRSWTEAFRRPWIVDDGSN